MIDTILYFMDNYSALGGAAYTILQQAVLMRRQNKRVTVAVSDYGEGEICQAYLQICQENDIEVVRHTFGVSNQPEDIDILSVLDHYEELRTFIAGLKPDILHSVQINPVVELISRELKIPHIMNIYPALPGFFACDYIDIFPRYHICDSQYYARVWREYLRTDSRCIRTASYQSYGIKDCYNAVRQYICVGNLDEGKNQISVIKAFHMAMEQGLKGQLKLYGHTDTKHLEICQNYISDNQLDDSISIEGFEKNMSAVYQNSEVLICGSRRESYPNVISEALANGLVVISTPAGDIPEVIRDRENGYLCNGYEADAIADKIMECEAAFASGTIQKILGNARITYETVHSPEAVTQKLLAAYGEIQQCYQPKESITPKKLREIFHGMIGQYEGHMQEFADACAVGKKLWYLYHITPILKRCMTKGSKKFYIWGTGKNGLMARQMIETFFEDIVPDGFIDSYKCGEINGLPVYAPQEILQDKGNVIFVGVANGQHDIITKLTDNGFLENENFFVLAPRRW